MTTLNLPQPLSMILKPGLDHMVRLEKSPTGHFCSLFNILDTFFFLFLFFFFFYFFFFIYMATASFWQGTLSNKTPTLASLSHALSSLPLFHSHHISHLCFSPSSPLATTSSAQIALAWFSQSLSASLSLSLHLCLSPSSWSATTDLSLRSLSTSIDKGFR